MNNWIWNNRFCCNLMGLLAARKIVVKHFRYPEIVNPCAINSRVWTGSEHVESEQWFSNNKSMTFNSIKLSYMLKQLNYLQIKKIFIAACRQSSNMF